MNKNGINDIKYDSLYEKNWYKSLREKLEALESTNVINKTLVEKIFYAVTKKELNFEEVKEDNL